MKKELVTSEEYNSWNEKKTLEGINSTLGDTEECISNPEDRIMEITQPEQQKRKKNF